MTDFSDTERRVYETIRHNTSGESWIDLAHVRVHCRNIAGSDIQAAVHDLSRAGLIETDEGSYRPTDPDRRIPHPGEIDTGTE